MKRALLAAGLLFAAACRSAMPLTCSGTEAPRAPRNFGVVDARFSRGGQPSGCSELAFLRDRGVRTIIKLNDAGSRDDLAEKGEATSLGLEMRAFHFDASTIGEPATCGAVREVLALLAHAEAPVFVHCTAGKDRTGYIAGLYEREVLGKTKREALDELHRYGHRGARAALFPQIDRELASDAPACAAPHLDPPQTSASEDTCPCPRGDGSRTIDEAMRCGDDEDMHGFASTIPPTDSAESDSAASDSRDLIRGF